MGKRSKTLTAMSLVTGLLAACSGDLVTGGELIRPGEPTGIIEVVNDTSTSFVAVLISACDVGSYGLGKRRVGEGGRTSILDH